jgi:hypothetical protein
MVAQAFYASEDHEGPIFATSLLQMARQASLDRQYIEAFRYCFLIFESLYGGGKFKTPQLVDAMMSDIEFESLVSSTIADFTNDPMHRTSKAKSLTATYSTSRLMIEHLVDRRGFYFHGNIKRKDTWRPDEQHHAEELANFCMFLGLAVADAQAAPMFVPHIGKRYFDNAKNVGAIMSFLITFEIKDEHNRIERGSMRIPTPGTIPTNGMAMGVHIKFLEWAQTELHGTSLVSAVANDETTGKELFRSQYLAPIPATT